MCILLVTHIFVGPLLLMHSFPRHSQHVLPPAPPWDTNAQNNTRCCFRNIWAGRSRQRRASPDPNPSLPGRSLQAQQAPGTRCPPPLRAVAAPSAGRARGRGQAREQETQGATTRGRAGGTTGGEGPLCHGRYKSGTVRNRSGSGEGVGFSAPKRIGDPRGGARACKQQGHLGPWRGSFSHDVYTVREA